MESPRPLVRHSLEYEARSSCDEEAHRRRRLFWIIFLGYIPGVALIALPLRWLSGSWSGAVVVVALWWTLILTAFVRLWSYRCAACGARFFYRGMLWKPWARRCVHCG
jgi:hypothetical protein